jgi:tetratricopeptide (TPR) repeat protein
MESDAFLQGVEAMDRKDYPSAIQHLQAAFAENPAQPPVLRALGQALILDQKYDQAEPVYEMLTRLVPDDDIARFNLAVIHSRLWQFSQAEQGYRDLLEKNPQANRVRYNLAAMYQIQGKLTQARDQWREIIRNAPELPSSYIALAEVEMQLNHPQAAVEAYAQASQLLPKEVSIYLNLSTAAEATGSYGLALTALKNARQVAPQDAEIYARIGQILLAMHRQTEKPELLQQAVSEWEKCLELDSTRQDIRDWLKTYRPITSAPAETSTPPTSDEEASLPE